ncbi:MAG: HD domain-containing protein [Atopostipes suicloacalis]|nr:HD domain-containing protein [Atopostipes suicloacalis]MDN6731208.1 HD domain-containing protein [Atopostipes suicloacalis]
MKLSSDKEKNILENEVIFKDPIHDSIHIRHQLILDLIDSKEFQRLRRIKQLGTAQYTFHGAEHSRFQHSLGVYELTQIICDHFVRNYPEDWDDSERLVTLAAALLHDIGHGPFSHTFEKIFHTDHEQFTIDIILDESTEVNQLLKKVAPNFPTKVASIIKGEYPNPQVVQLISSQIDADRMDYLQRDAYFTGVTYGMFDLSRILRVIRPYENGIAFQYQGMHAVEDYIVSRYQMYMQVYFHPVSRGMEVTLDRLLTRAKDLYEMGKLYPSAPALEAFFKKSVTVHDYLKIDDNILMSIISSWTESSDFDLSELAKMFLHRQPLKSIAFDRAKNEKTVQHLQNLVSQLYYDKDYYSMTNRSSDISYDYSLKEKAPITLIHPNGELIDLSEASPIVRILSDNLHGNDRLYVPRDLLRNNPPPQQSLEIFEKIYQEFQRYLINDRVKNSEELNEEDS